VHEDILDPKVTLFTDETWFRLSGYVNAKTEYIVTLLMDIDFEVPLHDQKISVCCAITAARILGTVHF
jgi:hypothetical protein